MKIQQRLAAILAAVFLLSGCFPILAVKAEQDIAQQEVTQTPDTETIGQESFQTLDTATAEQEGTQMPDTETAEQEVSQTPDAETAEQEDTQTLGTASSDLDSSNTSDADTTDETLLSDTTDAPGEKMTAFVTEDLYPIPDEPPEFHVRVHRLPMTYVVKGTFTDITPDIIQIYPLYSLDGESWQRVDDEYEWNLDFLGTDNETELFDLQNQLLDLDGMREPLISYVAGEIDCIYIKLHITKKSGRSYESRIAVIERVLQPIPEGITCSARFSAGVVVREPIPDTPWRSREYGRYQLTISEDTTAEDISAFLPDTLPVKVELMRGKSIPYASVVVNCPVTWKPLSLSSFSTGESITISDAAEKIQIPAGTQLRTPLGTFELDTPLSVIAKSDSYCDYFNEVELVLNVSQDDANPRGVLKEDRDGLKISLYRKATGAVSINAFVLAEGESKWTEIPGLSLLKELSAQPSTTNSGYALVLHNDQEPYRSYREYTAAGTEPTTFFIGLKIEGGIYDGKQLILAWPDIYEELPDLPKVGGAEGNEGNAGADNKNDSTESGQRPNLPITPNNEPEELQPNPPSASDDSRQEPQSAPNDTPETAPAVPVDQGSSSIDEHPADHQGNNDTPIQPESAPQISDDAGSGQQPNLPQITQDTTNLSSVEPYSPTNKKDESVNYPTQVQAVSDIKSDESANFVLSNIEIVKEHTTENDSRMPLLPALAAAAGVCIAAAVCKAAGCGLFGRIAGIIRHALHK